jgi:DNA repair exonuclease SbcCD ATPase subunit
VGAGIRPTPPPSVEEASAAALAADRDLKEEKACVERLFKVAHAAKEAAKCVHATHCRLLCLVAQMEAAALQAEERLDAVRGAPRRLQGAVGRARERAALQDRDAALAALRQAQEELDAEKQRLCEALHKADEAMRPIDEARQRLTAAGACTSAAVNTLLVAQAARQAAQQGRPRAESPAADEDPSEAGSGS